MLVKNNILEDIAYFLDFSLEMIESYSLDGHSLQHGLDIV